MSLSCPFYILSIHANLLIHTNLHRVDGSVGRRCDGKNIDLYDGHDTGPASCAGGADLVAKVFVSVESQ
jgi:hypothetical protein